MKKMIVLIAAAFLAFPVIASADLVGDCYDCHTMHNSEQNAPVVAAGPQPNLLRYDCLGCHAQNPTGGTKDWTGPGGSIIPAGCPWRHQLTSPVVTSTRQRPARCTVLLT